MEQISMGALLFFRVFGPWLIALWMVMFTFIVVRKLDEITDLLKEKK